MAHLLRGGLTILIIGRSEMTSAALSVLQNPKFDCEEFKSKWKAARISALKGAVPGASVDPRSEEELLVSVPAENREAVLRAVFNNSRKLGLSAARYMGVTWELSDLTELLPRIGGSCFSGQWSAHNQAFILGRKGCDSLARLGSFGCDYWREATDGLVMGSGENERLARHRSMGHGDDDCLDILFLEEAPAPRVVAASSCGSSAAQKSESYKFGNVPETLFEKLSDVRKKFEAMKVKLVLEGLSEGTLYYRLDAEEGVLCGAGGKLLHDSFLRDVVQLQPGLKTRDVAPLAVYGGST